MWAHLASASGVLAVAPAWWEEPTTLWLGLGLSLILAELVIPQLFVVFLGFGAIAVSAAIYLDWVSSPEAAMGVWVAASAALLWALRDVLIRIAPPSAEAGNPDIEGVVAGSYVQVVWVDPQDPHVGRVQFHGTQWDAWCEDAPLIAESWVRLAARQPEGWLVEPGPELDEEAQPASALSSL